MGKPHTLVVGGTGMLRDLCLALAIRGHVVSVVAQRPERLVALATEAASHHALINPLAVDYGHEIELTRRVRSAIEAHGPISTAVCWIHSDIPSALPALARLVRGQSPPARIFHVVSAAAARPALLSNPKALGADFPGVAFRRVMLGFKLEPGGSRWLNHEEIWKGVDAAIEHDWPESIVGLVAPWSQRPA